MAQEISDGKKALRHLIRNNTYLCFRDTIFGRGSDNHYPDGGEGGTARLPREKEVGETPERAKRVRRLTSSPAGKRVVPP
ncbi:hypothetical protein N782_07665 [Pontibacillus yanchengensis Y32]|uniref:Uncharacterized protein n=1 Tax=Pontibacillus yanchengensis Y32 TaxID=1385514 RepID=A0A0A2TBV6_9BACI|nr:hypothetical protein N782_07665 [Pontibacillus yanchengensis Y32]